MRRALSLGAGALVVLVGGCTVGPPGAPADLGADAELVSEQPASPHEVIVDGGSIRTILNHASLADVATSAVRIEVESASEYRYLDVPHTLSRVHVLDTVGGQDLTGRTLEVWQVGTASGPTEGLARPLRAADEYVVYVERLYLEPGEPTEQWTIVAQGSWKRTAADTYSLDVATDDPARLPDRALDPAVLDDVGHERAAALRTQVWDLRLAPSLDELAAAIKRAWAR